MTNTAVNICFRKPSWLYVRKTLTVYNVLSMSKIRLIYFIVIKKNNIRKKPHFQPQETILKTDFIS